MFDSSDGIDEQQDNPNAVLAVCRWSASNAFADF
jgi:hypothetical protein